MSDQTTSATVSVFASAHSWIESGALDQCHRVAALPGMRHVAGMPDLHPGKGAPIGAAMISSVLYPFLVGSDIGCGIAVFPFRLKRAVPERLAARFPDLDVPLDAAADAGDPAWAVLDGPIPAGHTDGLGTVGRGNHFVELARIGAVLDTGHADRLGLAAGDLVLIVHSGSRGLGERILRSHTEVHGAGPAPDPAAYLAAHDDAVRWGSLNRRLLAARVAHALGAPVEPPIVDECHNSVELRDGAYLHRKGAANGDGRDVLVAGTRGTPSFLVAGHAGAEAGFSVAHGAGRKMSRADALRRGRAKHTVEELRRTPVGSVVVCGDRQLLFEEAPTAYKRIEQVIADLVEHRLATRVASTIPLVTYKTADAEPRRRPSGADARGRAAETGPRRDRGRR
ncbi:RNA ligase RtcB family protein [Actinoplanes teichomyceticus]|uniref:3'-phosphate/5'-hydroxy nucleic acid ligase n=1 Tax=Actinoplanes teichomyceticus TaxID=1867 RepID=A0A561WC62_ACTTI|nr:RNA ligase RtcB family protein [Actinoplanes teichomyceticus]TWG21439.1 release factor H-coupled RctB family protein [Actinoplanes teichomyceticus]GIF16587.1 RtcB family protein [Actinoplanes teichomyceticus]